MAVGNGSLTRSAAAIDSKTAAVGPLFPRWQPRRWPQMMPIIKKLTTYSHSAKPASYVGRHAQLEHAPGRDDRKHAVLKGSRRPELMRATPAWLTPWPTNLPYSCGSRSGSRYSAPGARCPVPSREVVLGNRRATCCASVDSRAHQTPVAGLANSPRGPSTQPEANQIGPAAYGTRLPQPCSPWARPGVRLPHSRVF